MSRNVKSPSSRIFILLYYYWLSSLEFLVPLLRQESTYKNYDNGYFPTIAHGILV